MRRILRRLESKNQANKRVFFNAPNQETAALSLGQIVATPGALAALEKAGQQAHEFLSRHVHGGRGDVPDEDRRENQFSFERGFRLFSSYRTAANETAWVITEAHRSVTTLLLPEEY